MLARGFSENKEKPPVPLTLALKLRANEGFGQRRQRRRKGETYKEEFFSSLNVENFLRIKCSMINAQYSITN